MSFSCAPERTCLSSSRDFFLPAATPTTCGGSIDPFLARPGAAALANPRSVLNGRRPLRKSSTVLLNPTKSGVLSIFVSITRDCHLSQTPSFVATRYDIIEPVLFRFLLNCCLATTTQVSWSCPVCKRDRSIACLHSGHHRLQTASFAVGPQHGQAQPWTADISMVCLTPPLAPLGFTL